MNELGNYNIFLVGFMGVGKSTVAACLSKTLGMEQIELDEMISTEQGQPIKELFAQFGEPYFRDLESRALLELQQRNRVVVSCGGGIVLRPENGEYMKKNGKVVWLTATPNTVYDRVKGSDARPILNGNMSVEYISGLMEKRREAYKAAADIEVATDGKTASEIAEEIYAGILAL